MNNITYLDTSGLNFLTDYIQDFDLFAYWRNVLKIDFCLSAVGIWELLLSSNEQRKDKLLYWAQFNCAEYLLKSPSEIIVEYISNGCPKKDRRQFWDNRETNLDIGTTWSKIHGKIEKTIPVDLTALKKRTIPVRELSRRLCGILDNICDKDYENYHENPFHKAMLQALINLERKGAVSSESEKLLKTSLIFAFFFACIGMELDNSPIRKFWDNRKIEDPFERLDWIVNELPQAIVRGPIIEMAKMAEMQFKGKNSKSRGLVHDCLHSIYCYYADNIISEDNHFKTLKMQGDHEIFKGIIMAQDFREMWQKTIKKLTTEFTRM